jgi:hypothetical protein
MFSYNRMSLGLSIRLTCANLRVFLALPCSALRDIHRFYPESRTMVPAQF